MTIKRKSSYSDELKKKYGRISFGRFWVAWRTSEEMSQAQFARKLGLSFETFATLNKGGESLRPQELELLRKSWDSPKRELWLLL